MPFLMHWIDQQIWCGIMIMHSMTWLDNQGPYRPIQVIQ